MSFKSSQDVETRLADPTPLSSKEIADLFEWMHQISETGMRRLKSQLALQNLDAVQQFERSSSKLTKWLIGLTVVLVVLTIVIARYTVVLAHKESSAVQPQSTSQISTEEAYAQQLMRPLSPDDVISVCGRPQLDHVGDYGDYRWRILSYTNYEANFIFKENRWQYDFSSDGNGRVLPDAGMVRRPASIKLPCQP